jgi:EAL domain-containing protein (putative c-di-GMP-specific phosphodiesterase class I)
MDSAQPTIELVVSMARLFKMDVIAEGVETKEQLDMLTRYGCQECQGFLFAKPIAFVFLRICSGANIKK